MSGNTNEFFNEKQHESRYKAILGEENIKKSIIKIKKRPRTSFEKLLLLYAAPIP